MVQEYKVLLGVNNTINHELYLYIQHVIVLSGKCTEWDLALCINIEFNEVVIPRNVSIGVVKNTLLSKTINEAIYLQDNNLMRK